MVELRTKAQWAQLLNEWKREAVEFPGKVSAGAGYAIAGLLDAPTAIGGLASMDVGKIPEHGLAREYELGRERFSGGLGQATGRAWIDAEARARAKGLGTPELLAIDLLTPIPGASKAHAAESLAETATTLARAQVKGSGGLKLAAAGKPTGRALSRRLAELQATRAPAETAGRARLMEKAPFRTLKTTEEAIELARTGVHLQPKPNGGYVGGPARIMTEQDLVNARVELDELIKLGVEAGGADWYIRTKQGVRDITNGRASELRLGRELSVTSSKRRPVTNYDMAVGAHNAAQVGAEPKKIFQRLRRAFKGEAAGEPMAPGTYHKVEPYRQNITPDDPDVERLVPLPTNDTWAARALGFADNEAQGVSEARHAYMDGEFFAAVERANMSGLGGRADWTAPEIQASAWVALNGKDTAARYKWPLERGLREAAKSYPNYYGSHTYRSTFESTPGAPKHFKGLQGASYEEKAAYASGRPSWLGKSGRETLAEEAGLDLQLPGGEMVGSYQGVTSPGEYSQVQVGFATEPRRLAEAERAAFEKIEALRAVVDAQQSGAGHFTMLEGAPGLKAPELMGIEVRHGVALRPEQMATFERVVGEHAPLDWVANTGNRTIAQMTAPVSKALEGTLRSALQEAGIPLENLARAKHDAIFIDFSKEWEEGGGAVTRKLLEIMSGKDAPAVTARINASTAIKEAVLARLSYDAKIASRNIPGWEVDEAVQNFRRIFGEGGLDGLRAGLDAGTLLPSIVLPAIGVGIGMALSEEKEQQL